MSIGLRAIAGGCLISLAAATVAGGAAAHDNDHHGGRESRLKGEYAFTGSAHCVDSSVGFTPSPANQPICADTMLPIAPLGGPPATRNSCPGVSAHTFVVEGIRRFFGNGSGTVWGKAVSLNPPPNTLFQGAASSDFFYRFTYDVDGNNEFSTELVPGTYVGTFASGPRTGQTYTIDTLPFVGLIGIDAKTLTIANIEPTVETQTFSNGDVRYRICQRSRVLIKMDNDRR